MIRGKAPALPDPLVKALALGWSLAFFDGTPLTHITVLQGEARLRAGVLRGKDWLVALRAPVTLTGYERLSSDPRRCNHGMVLSLPATLAGCPRTLRLVWRHGGAALLDVTRPPPLPEIAADQVPVGLCMAPRACDRGHPFRTTFPVASRHVRNVAETAIRAGKPLPSDLPSNMLRCLLRDLSARPDPPASLIASLIALARQHDLPLYRALTDDGGRPASDSR